MVIVQRWEQNRLERSQSLIEAKTKLISLRASPHSLDKRCLIEHFLLIQLDDRSINFVEFLSIEEKEEFGGNSSQSYAKESIWLFERMKAPFEAVPQSDIDILPCLPMKHWRFANDVHLLRAQSHFYISVLKESCSPIDLPPSSAHNQSEQTGGKVSAGFANSSLSLISGDEKRASLQWHRFSYVIERRTIRFLLIIRSRQRKTSKWKFQWSIYRRENVWREEVHPLHSLQINNLQQLLCLFFLEELSSKISTRNEINELLPDTNKCTVLFQEQSSRKTNKSTIVHGTCKRSIHFLKNSSKKNLSEMRSVGDAS